MGLCTVYFDRECGDLPYTKAIIDERVKEWFINALGFQSGLPAPKPIEPEPTPEPEKAEAYVESGTRGCGAIDSAEFITAAVLQQRSKKGVAKLIFDKFGDKLDVDTKLVEIKALAVNIIKEKMK